MLVPDACDICKVTCNLPCVEAILDIIHRYSGPVLNKSWLLFPAFVSCFEVALSTYESWNGIWCVRMNFRMFWLDT
jgi:hypothetical protein